MMRRNAKNRELAGNILTGMFCLPALYQSTLHYMDSQRASSLIYVAYASLIILLFLIRRVPERITVSPREWIVALFATCLPFLLRPAAHFDDNAILLMVQTAGIVLCLGGLISLNRSFGLVPADRGVQTGGFYRIIRHPIYAGYFVSCGAYVAMNLAPENLVFYGLFLFFETWRMLMEEDFLGQNPSYKAYCRKTRWRLIPFVF